LALCGLMGCSTPPSAYQPVPGHTPSEGLYANEPLTEGDLISITCESVTNLNTTVKIPLNGILDLAFIGQVQAAGKTTQALQEELLTRYKEHVLAEEITVKLLQAAAKVYVSGAVLQPGKVPMDRPLTALEAVMEAGGFDPNRARLSKVTVVRVEGDRVVSYKVNLDKALKGDNAQPFYLKPFDTVHVPMKTINW
jgi:polysaccharide export outer membrane protein